MTESQEQEKAEVPLPRAPPLLTAHWFHAIDGPIIDPIAVRNAKREASLHNLNKSSPSPPPLRTSPKSWVPFSKRDTIALEKTFQENNKEPVSVNEDHLFQVDVTKREITPVYWEGPIYEVRRATWFMQGDGASKWIPCEEKMSKQIEEGYQKHKPYAKPIKEVSDVLPTLQQEKEQENLESTSSDKEKKTSSSSTITKGEEEVVKKPVVETEKEEKEEKEYLLGPYLGQYVVYTSPTEAWLLYDTTGAKIAKNFFTLLTKNQNLGGTKLIRGYREVEKEAKKKEAAENNKSKEKSSSSSQTPPPQDNKYEEAIKEKSRQMASDAIGKLSPEKKKELDDIEMTRHQAEDYDNEDSEEELRNIDQIVFVIHGIGQKMSERMGQNFVHDVNLLRKTIKSTWPIAISGTSPLDRPNGIQVLPVLWRKGIVFGTDNGEGGNEADMGMAGDDDGSPTIDEITLDGAPNIRTLVSDVFLDIPLYMTNKYHDLMINVITKEINRVYKLFIDRNPDFLKNNGKVNIVAHSLGSLLAFDILSAQPLTPSQKIQAERSGNDAAYTEKKVDTLAFPVKNYFAIGSPLGMIMLLRGNKMISRKALEPSKQTALSKYNISLPPSSSTATATAASSSTSSQFHDQTSPVTFVYPACDNIYNIFHKSDPVAYRLEPLVVRHYGAKLKPEPIAYIKGGLKSMLDAGFNVGNDIASKAGAMFESFKVGVTSNIIMRGLGFSKPLEHAYPIAEEMQWRSASDPEMQKTRAAAKSAAKLKLLNPTGRMDFYLQEGILENTYLSALSVHMSYWQDVDVAGFLVREIYRKEDNPELVNV